MNKRTIRLDSFVKDYAFHAFGLRIEHYDMAREEFVRRGSDPSNRVDAVREYWQFLNEWDDDE